MWQACLRGRSSGLLAWKLHPDGCQASGVALAHLAGTGVWLGSRRIGLETHRSAKAAAGVELLFCHDQPSP